MITITEAAQAHFRKLLSSQAADTHIRVFVVNPGTASAECGVSYCPRESVEPGDTELAFEGFSAFVDAESAPFLEEALIDYAVENLGGQLTLKAPNARGRKLPDDAPLEQRVQYVIDSEINPQLAAHSGHVGLVEITGDKYAILQFGGGCHGCGMVDVTLKGGVEKTLLEKFPELAGVRDVTDHSTGENPYY